jgi:hypothetical protein
MAAAGSISLSGNVHQNVAKLGFGPVFEHVNTLPGSEGELPVAHWDGKLDRRKSRPDMRRHVIA